MRAADTKKGGAAAPPFPVRQTIRLEADARGRDDLVTVGVEVEAARIRGVALEVDFALAVVRVAVFGTDVGVAADRELGDHPREFLSKIFHALSGANRYLDCWDFPSEGNGYLDVLPEPPALPWPWLSEDEFGYYVDEFTRTGFTGGLNWYRADDYVWEQNEELHGRPVTVPTTFIAGSKDPVLEMMGENPFETMAAMVPGLRSTHVIPDVGHFVQMEAADQVNTAMLEFLRGLD